MRDPIEHDLGHCALPGVGLGRGLVVDRGGQALARARLVLRGSGEERRAGDGVAEPRVERGGALAIDGAGGRGFACGDHPTVTVEIVERRTGKVFACGLERLETRRARLRGGGAQRSAVPPEPAEDCQRCGGGQRARAHPALPGQPGEGGRLSRCHRPRPSLASPSLARHPKRSVGQGKRAVFDNERHGWEGSCEAGLTDRTTPHSSRFRPVPRRHTPRS